VVGVKLHVFVLLPPLEHAPDQIASRPLETLSVICVPLVNAATPVLPTVTLMPAGLDVIRLPLRPDATTVTSQLAAAAGVRRLAVKVSFFTHQGRTSARLAWLRQPKSVT